MVIEIKTEMEGSLRKEVADKESWTDITRDFIDALRGLGYNPSDDFNEYLDRKDKQLDKRVSIFEDDIDPEATVELTDAGKEFFDKN